MEDGYLYSIQKKIGFLSAIICIISAVLNLLTYSLVDSFFVNISVLTIASIILFLTTIKNTIVLRLLQVIIFILFGTIAVAINPPYMYIGESFFSLGFLLAYQYKLIRKQWWIKAGIFLLYIVLLEVFAKKYPGDIVFVSLSNIIFSIACILVTILIFQEEITQHITTIKNNEIFVRLGLNYAGLVHALDYKRALKYISLVRRKMDKSEIDNANEILDKLTDFIGQQDRMRTNILTATKMNRLTEQQPVDINEVIRSVVAVYETDLILSEKIEFKPEMPENELIINAVPFEIFSIFQNIIQNTVDIANYSKKSIILNIRTKKEGKTISIEFTDTGPGFKNQKPGIPIDIKKVISRKVAKGFGLEYIEKTVKANEGKVEIMNNMERGASVKIQFIT